MLEYLQTRMKKGDIDEEEAVKQRTLYLGTQGLDDEGGEEEDIPEDLLDLSPQEQQARIRLRSCSSAFQTNLYPIACSLRRKSVGSSAVPTPF